MNTAQAETLLELTQWILWSNIALIVIFGLSAISHVTTLFQTVKNLHYRDHINKFSLQSAELFNKGEFTLLLELCNKTIDEYPMHAWAYWYKGRVFIRQEKFEDAKLNFEKVLSIEPTWLESIQPYFDTIERHMRPEVDEC